MPSSGGHQSHPGTDLDDNYGLLLDVLVGLEPDAGGEGPHPPHVAGDASETGLPMQCFNRVTNAML